MLLAGVAINALAGAGLGYLTFLATDEQLRNIQFWLLGSLGGARWSAVLLVGAIVAVAAGCGADAAPGRSTRSRWARRRRRCWACRWSASSVVPCW